MEQKKNLTILWIIAALILAVVAILIISRPEGQNQDKESASLIQNQEQTQNQQQNPMNTKTLSDGLQIIDEVIGTGVEAQRGKTLTVNYVGTLSDGEEFDSSYSRNQPISFTLGIGQVITGWDEGLVGMKVGGKRKLIIPPSLAYGSEGAGGGIIPPNATLTFEVELLKVE